MCWLGIVVGTECPREGESEVILSHPYSAAFVIL